MKKLQRKISIGLAKATSEDKGVSEEIILTEAYNEIGANGTGEVNNRSETNERDPEKETNPKVRELQRSRTGLKDKGVQRSNTIAYHSHSTSTSPAHVLRRKHSTKAPAKQTSKCGICYGDFTQPKQLPCLHTFCKNCLEKFVNPKLMVECPTCRKVFTHL